jgi:hypothetical protein
VVGILVVRKLISMLAHYNLMWGPFVCGGVVFLLGQAGQLPQNPFVKHYCCKLSLHLLSNLAKFTYMLASVSCSPN